MKHHHVIPDNLIYGFLPLLEDGFSFLQVGIFLYKIGNNESVSGMSNVIQSTHFDETETNVFFTEVLVRIAVKSGWRNGRQFLHARQPLDKLVIFLVAVSLVQFSMWFCSFRGNVRLLRASYFI